MQRLAGYGGRSKSGGCMAEEKDFYKDLIDNLYDGVYFVDRERVITYWNKGAERITGYIGNQVIGRSCRDNVLNHVTADGVQLCLDRCPLAACMDDGKVHEADVYLHHADGHRVPVLIRASPMRNSNETIIGAIEVFSSDAGILAVRHQLREMRHVAQTDALTGIGNRLKLDGRLRALIAEFHDQKGKAAVLFMDIDDFKQFNDTYGHEAGDRVLRMVAATLEHNLRKSDVVGRWGGDEFLAILHDVSSFEALIPICEKLRILVGYSRLDLQEKSFTVTISMGATLLLANDTPESIVRRADELLYRSKLSGRNRLSVG
jgi:diguanylate cyclase (GGDEF)-like protein/PAS domain S-box-containing protein